MVRRLAMAACLAAAASWLAGCAEDSLDVPLATSLQESPPPAVLPAEREGSADELPACSQKGAHERRPSVLRSIYTALAHGAAEALEETSSRSSASPTAENRRQRLR